MPENSIVNTMSLTPNKKGAANMMIGKKKPIIGSLLANDVNQEDFLSDVSCKSRIERNSKR
jgi:hypothetical protein